MNKNGGYQIELVEYNKRMMEKFDVLTEIRNLICVHDDGDKFIFNEFTQRTQINPTMLTRTNLYNAYKKVVRDAYNKRTGMIDLSLLDSFVKLGAIKLNILNVSNKYGIKMKFRDGVDLLNQHSIEIQNTKLNSIQEELSNDSEILFEADQKIDNILSLMPNLFKLKDDFCAF